MAADNLEFYRAFSGFYTEAYRGVDADEAVRQWSHVLGAVEIVPGHERRKPRLLDVACGPGRHLAAWARRGYEAAGVDANPQMLATAAQYHSLHGCRNIPLILSDIRELARAAPELAGRFDVAAAHFNFPHLFAPPQLPRALAGAAFCLRPGGYFIFDFCPFPQTPPEPVDEWVQAGRHRLHRVGEFLPDRGCYRQRWISDELDVVENFWFHGAAEYRSALAQSGLEGEQCFEWRPEQTSTPWAAYAAASRRAVFLCRRAGG